ncbi:glycosyltransferase family 2 protein [Catenuloplanes japonicus]|uniref:glycosyltransferase family 2 protein n=1 Tax=Catenuloplanes japonicus TaxID=33876 RepID=UPI0005258302|nr:glycosyltransferase family 2 protein [Catenuloplanes japonicus]
MVSANLRLAAVIIVRDEAELLARCLTSLRDVVDEIHVHDTGSTDGSADVAVRAGAHVTTGLWNNHFAEVRNAALSGWTADWVLSVDADDQVHADLPRLRELLASMPEDAASLEIDNERQGDPFTYRTVRLFRPARTRWVGRVHEHVTARDGVLRVHDLPRDIIRLAHTGYDTAEQRTEKALRNMVLGRMELDDLASDPAGNRDLIARTLLDLGRSCIGAGHKQDAVDTLEMLRDLFPRTRERLQGTDHLAQLMLAEGMDEVALVLVEDMRAGGAEPTYCDWLASQALAQLGEVDEAARLLGNVGRIVDTAGRRHNASALAEMKQLVAALQARLTTV